MLDRKAMKTIKTWYGSTRRKPLVLRGARQVGKSTVVETVAAALGVNLITVNCEKNRQLEAIFAGLDMARIVSELEAIAGQGPINAETILFLDEIQATPTALQALRYFYEERPELPVIAAGSLLEFSLSDHHFSMPVGRIQYLHLGPLTFREFVEAIDPERIRYLDELTPDHHLPDAAHSALCSLQRSYLFTGGMPEAVAVYQKTRSLTEVSAVHGEIVETYTDDFSKYARNKDLVLLQRVFSSIPRLLGQKIKYVNLARGERAALLRAMIDLLIKAQVVLPVWHSHCSGIPLGADIDDTVFKLAFLDIGLANHLCGTGWQDLVGSDEVRLVNEGGVAEQFIAQQLAWMGARKPELTYWHREGRSANAEVDFTRAFGSTIYPIEVKSGKSGSLKSLQQFVLKKKAKLAFRFDLNQPSRQQITQKARTKEGSEQVSYELISLPLYAVGELPRIVENER
jgi:predicted AAA+ superfamily ATPase